MKSINKLALVSVMFAAAAPAFAQPGRVVGPVAGPVVGPVIAKPAPPVVVPPKGETETPPATPDPPEPPDSREPGQDSGPVGKLTPLEFYRGPVVVESVVGGIDLVRGEAPKASVQVTLANRSARGEQIAFGFRGGGQPAAALLAPGGRAVVNLTPFASHVGKADGPQIVRMDLVMTAGGMPMGLPPERVDLQVRLPAGVRGLLRSNQPLKAGDNGAGGGLYRLNTGRAFVPELVLAYTGGPVSLGIAKSVEPGIIRGQGPVSVKLTVQNLGPGDAKNVVVSDNFDPRDFDGSGEGFAIENGKENDSRLVFTRALPFLAAGQSQTIEVVLKAKGPVGAASLSAATASMDGAVVGVSNKVFLPEVVTGPK